MQSPFLIKGGFPLSLFLKSAVVSLLQPPMHSTTVSKMWSDLMSTALGVTLLWSKAEQWEEEGKICSVVMTRVLSFSSSAEHKIPISSMREGDNEAVAGAGSQAGMGTSHQMLVHFVNKSVHQ